MIDDIINSLKGELGGSLMEKFGLDNSQKDQAMDITKETITEKISGAASGGGISGIMNLFSSNDNDEEGNSMLEDITSSLSGKFSSQLGVDSEKSGGITSMIMDKVTSMFGDKLGGNFAIGDLLGMIGGDKLGGITDMLGGGKSGGLGGMLGKLGGLFGKK
ncbi:MAG: hypothetical protein ABF258_03340 [Flavobacteriales bacterium]